MRTNDLDGTDASPLAKRPRRSWPAVLCLAAGALAGCASPPAATLHEALARAATAETPSGYRVAIAPLAIDEAATMRGEADEAVCPVPVDLKRLTGELSQAIRACRRFGDEVVALPRVERGKVAAASKGEEKKEEAGPTQIFAPVPPERIQTALSQAFAKNVDVLVQAKVTRQRVRFVEHNGWFFPNLVNLAVLIWPAYFVADERFDAEMTVELELWSVKRRELLAKKTITAKALPQDVTELDRGWLLTGSAFVPGSLSPENFARAGEVVLPHARNDLVQALSRYLSEVALPPKKVAGTLAVCAGVGDSRHKIQRAVVFSDDARAVAAALALDAKVPPRNIRILTETVPTRAGLLSAIRDRARHAREGDTLLVYFSGFGFQAADELYLVTADIHPDRPRRTAVSLHDLEQALEGCPARQVLVLDTSFGPASLAETTQTAEQGRTFTRAAGLRAALPKPTRPATELLDAFAKASPNRTVLLATGPGQAAYLLDDDLAVQHGFFTGRLLSALKNPHTDTSGDGTLDLGEVFALARRQTIGRTSASDLVQEPLALGRAPTDIVLGAAPPPETAPAPSGQ